MANAFETAPITLSSGTIASAASNSFSLGLSSVFMMLPTTEVSSNLTYLLKGSRKTLLIVVDRLCVPQRSVPALTSRPFGSASFAFD